MSNYIEYNDKIAFHPGYYISEAIEESGLTQYDFAKRLDTTPKNISCLVNGEQKLSTDIAMKLARMLGTSVEYWLNLQTAYDTVTAEIKSDEALQEERKIFSYLDYKYFQTNFNLPALPRKKDLQIEQVRKFLNVSTLAVFRERDMAVSFRSSTAVLEESYIVKANIMVQIATNLALKNPAPKFDRNQFNKVVNFALTLTRNHHDFYPLLYKAFFDAGVNFVVLPNLPGSKINGATKKIKNNIVLMVNDRRMYSDTFWFTLFHEIGHINNGDLGITFEDALHHAEGETDTYAENKLIPPEAYTLFVKIVIIILQCKTSPILPVRLTGIPALYSAVCKMTGLLIIKTGVLSNYKKNIKCVLKLTDRFITGQFYLRVIKVLSYLNSLLFTNRS